MATSSKIINISKKAGSLKSANKSTNKKNQDSIKSIQLIEPSIIEERLAGLLKASRVISTKSVKSAVYLLVKNLVKRGQNIVTVNSVALFKNEIIRERLGIEVRLAEDDTLNSYKELIDEHTGLIFIESLGIHNHIIPDFQKIIAFANSRNIPVAVENTIGLAGNIFNPIASGADFSIENFESWNFPNSNIKTILIEKKETSYTFFDKIKAIAPSQDTPLALPANLIAKVKEFEESSERIKKVAAASLITAKWLKEITHIKKVDFVGFPSHGSHFNALKYFSSGYGNVISLSLWANYRSFDFFLDNLIPKSFSLFKINNINHEQKKVTISLLEHDVEKVVAHFQNAFELLQKYLGSDYFLYENLYDAQDAVGY